MFDKIQAVLFDLDGTLVDSAPDLGAAADKMRTDRGLPAYPLERYRPMAGAGARGMLEIAFGLAPESSDFAAMKEEFFANYEAALTQRSFVFEGVEDLIAQLLARGIKWGVVTNKAERFTLPLTAQMPLFSSASAIISGDTTPHAKPHPEPVLEAARRMAVEPKHCVYVGDDLRDIIAGRAAGMWTVAASYGYLGKATEVQEWGAHANIASIADLLPLIH